MKSEEEKRLLQGEEVEEWAGKDDVQTRDHELKKLEGSSTA